MTFARLWRFCIEFAEGIKFFFTNRNDSEPLISPVVAPEPPPATIPPPAPPTPPPPLTTPPTSKYDWAGPTAVRHSVRVICDEEGLTVEQKNTMCATIGGESEYNPNAINYNRINGKLYSTDYGLCQWNDVYHGSEISPQDALHDPEKAVRLMCAYWKRGQRTLWIAYKNGSYKNYL
jgi:hypothetical protein